MSLLKELKEIMFPSSIRTYLK